MVDSTIQGAIGSEADPQLHELTIVGVAVSSVENAVHRLVVHVGRTSTHPAITDAGVRTRDYPANPAGLPFVFRIKALRMNAGDILGIFTFIAVEEDASSVHQDTLTVKDVFVTGPFQASSRRRR